MTEDDNRELRRALDGLFESIRPRVELPKWQVENVYSAWSGNLAKTLGSAYTQSLPKFCTNQSVMGAGLLHGYLKDAGFFRNMFSLQTMPWMRSTPVLSRNLLSGFDFTQLSTFVSSPEVEEGLDELIEANDEVKDFAEDSVSEVAESTGVSRPVAMRLSVAAVFVIHWGLVLFILTGFPLSELIPFIIATLSARGDAKDVIARFKAEDKD